ncbi:MAG: hypothetical protein EU532_09925 [Promethearchaeota archaeon]|nr:MAG: hypothetical protein EU532_09925 [Candidatus Lokiarchaeota archaeon]
MEEFIEQAGNTIVNVCSKLKKDEKATILTDKETINIGLMIKKYSEDITEKVNFHILEDYAERPLTHIPEKIKKDVKKSDVTYYAAQSKQGELQNFRGPLVGLAIRSGREIHMPNINDEIIKTGMQANYYKIASLTYMVTSIAVKSRSARISTPKGTDLTVTFSDRINWVPDTGLLWYKGMWGNLPAGEVFTCPDSVEGIMIIDGTLGDFFNEKYGHLKHTPVRIPIKKSRAITNDIQCDNKELLEEFKGYLTQGDNSNKVGEFGCGTNVALTALIGNLLQDEKYPGVHIAFGNPYPDQTGANWNANGHVDGIMEKCSLWFDDKLIIENGRFIEKELFSFY